MQKAWNFNVATVSAKKNDYRIHFLCMSNNEVTNIVKNSDLKEKIGFLQEYKIFFLSIHKRFFLAYI